MKSRTYQPGFYSLSAKVRDRESRRSQADKIIHVLTQLALHPFHSAVCLDVGCSSGVITTTLSHLFARIIGLDYDQLALEDIDPAAFQVASFLRGDAMSLPFATCSVDVIICAQVYEHVPDDEKLVVEIYRVLKPGGMVFFSGPNKLYPIEPHYFLPFLHWLPEKWADRYLQILGKGDRFYERSRTLWELRKLLAQFTIQDVTVQVLHWKMQHAGSMLRILGGLPTWLWQWLLPVLPNYNWLLYKPHFAEPSVNDTA